MYNSTLVPAPHPIVNWHMQTLPEGLMVLPVGRSYTQVSKISGKIKAITARIQVAVHNFKTSNRVDSLVGALNQAHRDLKRLEKRDKNRVYASRFRELESSCAQIEKQLYEKFMQNSLWGKLYQGAIWLNQQIKFLPGARAEQTGDSVESILNDLNELIALEPGKGLHYSQRALIYLRLNLLDKALADAEWGVAQAPASPLSHFSLARVHEALGHPKKAAIEYIQSRSLALPWNYRDFSSRLLCVISASYIIDLAATVDWVDLAATENWVKPVDAENWIEHAATKNWIGLAAADLKSLLQEDPRIVTKSGIYNLYLAIVEKNSSKKKKLLQKAIHLGLDDTVELAKAHYQLALVLAWEGMVAEAVKALDNASSIHLVSLASLPKYQFLKGALELLGNPQGYKIAKAHLDRAAALGINVQRELLDLCLKANRSEVATAYFEQRAKDSPDTWNTLWLFFEITIFIAFLSFLVYWSRFKPINIQKQQPIAAPVLAAPVAAPVRVPKTAAPQLENDDSAEKREQFTAFINKIFEKSSVGLSFAAVLRERRTFKAFIDLQSPKYRECLELHRNDYAAVISEIFGTVDTRTLEDSANGIYRWIFTVSHEKPLIAVSEQNIQASQKKIKDLDQSLTPKRSESSKKEK